MKRTTVAGAIVLALLTFWLAGCKGKETASINAAGPSAPPSPAPAANANSPVTSGAQPTTAPSTPEPPKLLGTYEAREVENKGVVTLISKIKTLFVFRADGTYSRVSQLKGKTYHSDSGQFRIEADKLVITIEISDNNMKTPAVVKTQRFRLSPDGNELKLISVKKESTATFQRTSKPTA
ncbi:MAG TPA: hypothetical protein VN937_08555 [Blastocatellia bacterium]|nr:hypothetical protein [Blastocatellia bacterium]